MVPPIFTGIAFDSGACEAVGGNILTDAFGLVALVAMTPLVTIQLLGLWYRVKTSRMPAAALEEDEIIQYDLEEVR